ncbi:MAG: tetratricopeptide repeat protein [Candidatus Thorarchaeota archaeon]
MEAFHEGRNLEKKGKYKEALSSYEKAVTLDETLSKAWFYKFKIHLQFGHEEEAQACAQKAIDLDPKWNKFVAKIQKEVETKKRKRREIERSKREEETREKSPEELFIAAVKQVAVNQGSPISVNGPTRETHDLFYKARAAENAGRYDEALELYGNVVEIDETYAKAWFQKFLIHYIREEFEPAKECAARAFALDSKYLKFVERSINPKRMEELRKPSAERSAPSIQFRQPQRRRRQTKQLTTETVIYRGAVKAATDWFRGMGPQKIIHPETGEEWIIEVSLNDTNIHSYKSPRGKISSKRYGPKERRFLVAALETSRQRFPEKEARLREIRRKLSGT